VASVDDPGNIGRLVAHTHSSAVYADGYLLYLRENTLMAQPFDVGRLETTGEPVAVAQGVPTYISPSRGAPVTVSATGLLVYQAGGGGFTWRLVERDRHGAALRTIVKGAQQLQDPALSPDERRLALVQVGQGEGIWLYNLVGGSSTPFTFGALAQHPEWSSSGDAIFYDAPANGHAELFRKPANGATRERSVFDDKQTKLFPSVSPDGKWILYAVPAESANGRDEIWQQSLGSTGSTGPEPHRFIQIRGNATTPQFSPDGQWVAYSADESGRFEVYVAPFSGPGERQQVSFGGGKVPRWRRRDGRELYYVTDVGQVNAVEITIGNGTLETGRMETLFDGVSGAVNEPFTPSADGQRFFVVENAVDVGRPLTIVENWTALLKK
jgi:dipeptidyl aminopeptidase/acylaminoacyl peptidase